MNKTILVVDDDIGLRNAISLALRKNNFTVITAENGIDGLGKLHHLKPSLIISDLKMPELDGLEFLKHAREKLPNTPPHHTSHIQSQIHIYSNKNQVLGLKHQTQLTSEYL